MTDGTVLHCAKSAAWGLAKKRKGPAFLVEIDLRQRNTSEAMTHPK